MIYNLVIFILFSSLFVESLANLTTSTLIFDNWRIFLGKLGQKLKLYSQDGTNLLGYLGECHLCTSHQISFIVTLFFPFIYFFPTSFPFINFVLISLIIGRLSYIFHLIFDRIQSINVNLTSTNINITDLQS